MADERLDYAILISLAMREEAEVMASALRAEGIDALVGNGQHINSDWHLTLALGGVQVLVPRQKLEEAKVTLGALLDEARAHSEDEPVGRRDRWKLWAVIGVYTGLPALLALVAMAWPAPDVQEVVTPEPTAREAEVYFAAPEDLSEHEQRGVLRDYCRDRPNHTVISREDGMGYVTPCPDVMRLE